MAAWQPEEMNSLYCHVMAHAEKFADVTCDGGAEAFNFDIASLEAMAQARAAQLGAQFGAQFGALL